MIYKGPKPQRCRYRINARASHEAEACVEDRLKAYGLKVKAGPRVILPEGADVTVMENETDLMCYGRRIEVKMPRAPFSDDPSDPQTGKPFWADRCDDWEGFDPKPSAYVYVSMVNGNMLVGDVSQPDKALKYVRQWSRDQRKWFDMWVVRPEFLRSFGWLVRALIKVRDRERERVRRHERRYEKAWCDMVAKGWLAPQGAQLKLQG